jgi:hypothetical protein
VAFSIFPPVRPYRKQHSPDVVKREFSYTTGRDNCYRTSTPNQQSFSANQRKGLSC